MTRWVIYLSVMAYCFGLKKCWNWNSLDFSTEMAFFCRIFRPCEPLFMQQNVGLPHVIGFKGTWNMFPQIVMFHGIRLKLVEKHHDSHFWFLYFWWLHLAVANGNYQGNESNTRFANILSTSTLQYVWYMFTMFWHIRFLSWLIVK